MNPAAPVLLDMRQLFASRPTRFAGVSLPWDAEDPGAKGVGSETRCGVDIYNGG